MLDGTWFFECNCAFDEHTIRFTLDKEDKELYTSVFLSNHRNIFVRTWIAIKYILGYKSRYGYFGSWTLNPDDVDRLEQMIKEFKQGDYLRKPK